MQIQEQMIAEIAQEVVARLRAQMQQPAATSARGKSLTAARDGVFATVDEAANAAWKIAGA